MLIVWGLTNLFFVVIFTHNYVVYSQLQHKQQQRIEKRKSMVLGRTAAAPKLAGEERGNVTWRESLEVAYNIIIKKSANRRCLCLSRFFTTLWRLLGLLCYLLVVALSQLPQLLDALLLCHCLKNFCRRWRRALQHYKDHHLTNAVSQWDKLPLKAPPYQPHEQSRMYGVSTKRNRMV